MRSEVFSISGESYTKLAVEVRIRHILHDSELGVELDGDNEAFIREIMKRHPEAASKIGAGVRAIRVTSSKYGNRCFEALRLDGTSVEFSYIKCLGKQKAKA